MTTTPAADTPVTFVELRAIVRLAVLDRVIHALRATGCPRLTVSHVHAIGAGVDPSAAAVSLLEGSAVSEVALVQLVCGAGQAESLTTAILDAARTGHRGDGIVTQHPVLAVTKIRTGAAGNEALQ